MYGSNKDAVKRIHRLLKPWKNRFCAVWESPLLYHRNPYYLNIFFNSRFCITKIHTNHEHLKQLYTIGATPKTLYRILDSEIHTSLLILFYHLKYVYPEKLDFIHLHLNSSYLRAYGYLKVISSGKKYCFKLKIHSVYHSEGLLDLYQKVPLHKRKIAYRLYGKIHQIPFRNQVKIAGILKSYPYSKSVIYEVFQQVIGVPPSHVWLDRRLLSFLLHLLQTEESITSSYSQFGFSSTSHLHRYFRKVFAISPLTFREKYGQK